ncbi:MAG: CRISPR-associated endonuclease Cas2 [Bifidobacteriaceae bacterium]|jgi:CRISPR-associated protein Cas2|nr:CRISPR-associated endonuclease Cas2 [Bifidobacteriaceae bacterium]
MFDLPVLTKQQRRDATRFRLLLLDCGYIRVQLSVYAKFSPTASSIIPSIRKVKMGLPPGGEVRILAVTDHQWASADRFSNDTTAKPEPTPELLTIF